MKTPEDPVLIQCLFDILTKANQAGAHALLLLADIKSSTVCIPAMEVRIVTVGKHHFRGLLTEAQYERLTKGKKLTLPLLVKRLASLRKLALTAGAQFRDRMVDFYNARLTMVPKADIEPAPLICCSYDDTYELMEPGECANIPDSVQVPLSYCSESKTPPVGGG